MPLPHSDIQLQRSRPRSKKVVPPRPDLITAALNPIEKIAPQSTGLHIFCAFHYAVRMPESRSNGRTAHRQRPCHPYARPGTKDPLHPPGLNKFAGSSAVRTSWASSMNPLFQMSFSPIMSALSLSVSADPCIVILVAYETAENVHRMFRVLKISLDSEGR